MASRTSPLCPFAFLCLGCLMNLISAATTNPTSMTTLVTIDVHTESITDTTEPSLVTTTAIPASTATAVTTDIYTQTLVTGEDTSELSSVTTIAKPASRTTAVTTDGYTESIAETTMPTEPTKENDSWKIIVGVTVSTGGVLLIAIVALLCWQQRYWQKTSKKEGLEVNHYSLAEPTTGMTANNNGTVGEIIFPWREQAIEVENDDMFGTETGTRVTSPTPDHIEDFGKQVSIPRAEHRASSLNGFASEPLEETVFIYNNDTYGIVDDV
ncbi:uncharacterized protein [Diadema antillarum]|uniref:uncharacterized protein n=1 Tax=Diadema antillarum TaxID=105358 RepID=UPI003A8B6F31